MKPTDFNTGQRPVWCPGCGNFAIWNSIKKALAESEISPHKTSLVSGIGCSGKMINHVRAYGVHALHGRTLPVATGIKMANPEMTVIVNGGDGDGYGMGAGHFIHAIRRNIDLTYIVHDNRVYGLTTGQASPTAERGTPSKSTPFGVVDAQMNPLKIALSAGATFVARSYSGASEHLAEMIHLAIAHKGFAYIDVFQPCVTFGGDFKYEYYDDKVYKLEGNDTSCYATAEQLASETEKLPLGILYQTERPSYVDEHPEISTSEGVVKKDVRKLFDKFK
jgi:2-oxoglutarate ferredoxin oxidoreductase subunit beta